MCLDHVSAHSAMSEEEEKVSLIEKQVGNQEQIESYFRFNEKNA